MSDARLRELQRRYQGAGTPEEAFALLRAALRGGTVTSERARCAAALGDPVARRLELEPWPGDPWGDGLAALDEGALRRFACDCAEQVLPAWQAYRAGDDAPAAAIAAARRFAAGELDPAALQVAWAEARRAAAEAAAALGPEAPATRAVQAARLLARGGPFDPAAALAVAEEAARTARLPLAPGNPVHDAQRARLIDYLLARGTALREAPPALPTYSPSFRFGVGDRLRHPRFGEGVVRRADARRIEVEFEDASRVLAHGV